MGKHKKPRQPKTNSNAESGSTLTIPALGQFRAVLAVVLLFACAAWLSNFAPPLAQTVTAEFQQDSGASQEQPARHSDEGFPFLRDELRTQLHEEEYELDVPLLGRLAEIPWRQYPFWLFGGYLLFFVARRDVLTLFRNLLDRVVNLKHLSRSANVLTENKYVAACLTAAASLRLPMLVQKLLLIATTVLFFAAVAMQLLIFHYDAWRTFTPDDRRFLMALIGVTMFLMVLPDPSRAPAMPYSGGRRRLIAGGVSAVLAGLVVPLRLPERLTQFALFGSFPKPRFVRQNPVHKYKVALAPGLYRHRKSNHLHFVDNDGFVRNSSAIKEKNLTRIQRPVESDFPLMSRLTADAYFESWALGSIERGNLLDALAILDMGSKYEMYRLVAHPKEQPNIRVLKLYAGLCYRTQNRNRLLAFRKAMRDHNLVAIVQKPDEKWLGKAWCFKRRWLMRESYNGVPLKKILSSQPVNL